MTDAPLAQVTTLQPATKDRILSGALAALLPFACCTKPWYKETDTCLSMPGATIATKGMCGGCKARLFIDAAVLGDLALDVVDALDAYTEQTDKLSRVFDDRDRDEIVRTRDAAWHRLTGAFRLYQEGRAARELPHAIAHSRK